MDGQSYERPHEAAPRSRQQRGAAVRGMDRSPAPVTRLTDNTTQGSVTPDLAAALTAINEGNVASGLDFLTEAAILSKDPAQCYGQSLLRAAAAAKGSEQRLAVARLRAAYGKEFSCQRFNADAKEIKAELTRVEAPSRLLVSDNGAPKPILANAITELQAHLTLGYNSFASVVTHLKPSPWGTSGPWRDLDDVAAANYLQHAGVTVNGAIANEAAYFIAYQNEFHPVRDWLTTENETWDGTPRLDTWMVDYLGAPNSTYVQAISAKWIISAVARIMRPGCKADHMLVLEGKQGKRKSTSLRALANGHLDTDHGIQWFTDAAPEIDSDDMGLFLQGVWIIEMAELDSIRRHEWTHVNRFITNQADRFRRKYGRNMQAYPRQCVLAGSTNEHQWAGDPTGARRFWPVKTGVINVDGILRWRSQIFAEARFRYDEGETHWLDETTEALARGEQEHRAPEDTWADRISTACAALVAGLGAEDVSVNEIMDKLNISEDKRTGAGPIIGRTLIRLGWELFHVRETGNRGRRYRKPE